MSNINKQLAIRVTLVGSALDLFLGILKIIFGYVFFSHALIVDGVHSLSDILTDGFVLLVTKFAHDKPDENHPYGHARFETFGTIIIGFILILLAIFLIKENIDRYIVGAEVQIPKWPTLIAAFISIVSKEWIYRYTLSVGNKINSKLILANAWHSRTDAISSILVFVSLVLSMSGLDEVDVLAAILIAGFIGKVGWDFIWSSIKELVDTSVEQNKLAQIKEAILAVDGVKGFHNLRSRKMGDRALVDVNIEVDNYLTVSEGHEISSWVSKNLIEKYDYLFDVTVHTDVEDDRIDGEEFLCDSEFLLPLRSEVVSEMKRVLSEQDFSNLLEIRLHYISRKINLELIVSSQPGSRVKSSLEKISYIRRVDFLSYINS